MTINLLLVFWFHPTGGILYHRNLSVRRGFSIFLDSYIFFRAPVCLDTVDPIFFDLLIGVLVNIFLTWDLDGVYFLLRDRQINTPLPNLRIDLGGTSN